MFIRLIILFIFVFTNGCSSINLKNEPASNDIRFLKAKSFLDNNKFEKAKSNFLQILDSEKGSELALLSHFYLGYSYYGLKNYDESIYNFNYYSMFSKDIMKIEDSQFMKSKCVYKMTLPFKNDQTQTFLAISTIQEFLDNFPTSKYGYEINTMITSLRNKISKKYYETGRLYMKMKSYNAAKYYFDLVIDDYYDTKYYNEAKISYIFNYILMDDYEGAVIYYNENKDSFDFEAKEEANYILSKYKHKIGLSGYYRLYR
jgi:outer membrane protein assembly factor BamD